MHAKLQLDIEIVARCWLLPLRETADVHVTPQHRYVADGAQPHPRADLLR